MALIVIHHTIADNFEVDPAYSVSTSGRILAGQIVGLNSSGYVVPADSTNLPLGIAGDSISDEYKTTAFSADLVVSPGRAINNGASHTAGTRWTSNRVSDMFNETLASGLMTVYIGAGKFASDQYDITRTYVPGNLLYTNASGKFTLSTGSGAVTGRKVGYIAKTTTDYPSGVPGVDSPSVANSMSLGTFLTFHLSI